MEQQRDYDSILYRDPSTEGNSGAHLKTGSMRLPTPEEIILKLNRDNDFRFDEYGVYDPKMSRPSFYKSYPKNNKKKGGNINE